MPIVPNSRFALQDLRSHKEYCSKIKAAGANSLDAILFAVNETKPRLVKIPWELILGEEDEPPFQRLDTDIWFKHKDKFVRHQYFRHLEINGREPGRTLCYILDDNSSIDGLPLNCCIVATTGGKAVHPWSGYILALRLDSPYSYDFYANVDMQEDFTDICNIFRGDSNTCMLASSW